MVVDCDINDPQKSIKFSHLSLLMGILDHHADLAEQSNADKFFVDLIGIIRKEALNLKSF